MNCGEEHEPVMNRRRYRRYEIDTQLQVMLLGSEQRGTLRGRSLNISEAGIAGVFVTVWDVSAPVHLEFSVEQREIINKTCRTLALLE